MVDPIPDGMRTRTVTTGGSPDASDLGQGRLWRLIVSGKLPGAVNMAMDEAILRAHAEGKAPPTIRFYGWQPPALSVGALQRASLEVDVEACRAAGVDIVRRPTGGRAVLHDDELTYSVIVSESHPLLPRGIREAYSFIARGLVDGLGRMGITAGIAAADNPGRPEGGGGAKDFTPACFESPSWYEIVARDGRKLVGSAQMRSSGILLQHGSIPLTLDPGKLFKLLRFSDPNAREGSVERLKARATSVLELLGTVPCTDGLIAALVEGIQHRLGIMLTRDGLSPDEAACAGALARDKYSQDTWNFRR